MPAPDQSTRGAFRPQAGTAEVIEAAAAAFRAEYGDVTAAPVTVLLAAFNEVESVASVVASIPRSVSGLDTECVVVDDGSVDGTAGAAREAGAMVCRLATNLGQGQALRLGYRLAAERGARVIATMDADGQFEASELERLVGPVASGEADFVNGSRRLGRSETTDGVRRAGVVLFGALVSALTRSRITDPANGFRAFRPEVTTAVPLHQVQYQTAELLIGALALGFRVVEAPVTVRARTGGTSKKGGNLRYGYRFGRVILSTWWRLSRRSHAQRPFRRRSAR